MQIDGARLPFCTSNSVQQPPIGSHHRGTTLIRQHQIEAVVNRVPEFT